MSDEKRLEKLKQITELTFSVDQAAVARLMSDIAELDRQLEHIENDVRQICAAELNPDVAFRLGANFTWLAWAEDRKKTINVEKAKLFSALERKRSKLSQSFGKDHVAQKLLETAKLRQNHRS